MKGFRCNRQLRIQSCKKGLLVALKKRRCRVVLWLLTTGSVTAVISSFPMLVLLLIHSLKRERVELYSMSFEYPKSPRGSKVEFGQVGGEFSSGEKLLKNN